MSTYPCPPIISLPLPQSKVAEVHALDARTPILFLPVYLETRFVDPPTGPELWIRVFPDQLSINSHEPELTHQEIDDAEAYWSNVWAAIKSASLSGLQAPWSNLASKYGAPRAAWISRQMTPTNLPPAASLTLTFGSASITFTSSRYGAGGNRVQIAIDATSRNELPVVVTGDLITLYAMWDGTLHTTAEIVRFFPSSKTDHGGPITAVAAGTPQPVGARTATNLAGGQDPSGLPSWPSPLPPLRDSSWEKPAIAYALPDRWTAVLISGTQQKVAVFPQPIQLDLAVGLDPKAGKTFTPGSPVDAGMQWMVDFKEAVKKGMAAPIGISGQQRRAGFDRIFVYGLRSRDTSGAFTFGSLLDGHHYTDGLAFVLQGAATNNTPDASSAYSRKDTGFLTSFAVETQAPLINDPANAPDADGNRFATLLGIDPYKMSHVQYADGTCSRNGTDMMVALWPATLGYFLSQMMDATFSPEWIEMARQYIACNAVPRGAIPVFRVGHTPYGVLPITSISRYKLTPDLAGTPFELELVSLLRQLWPTWLASSANAPHIQRTGDPDQQLAAVLGMDGRSTAFRGRSVFGDEFLWNYMNFLGMRINEMNAWWGVDLQAGRGLLNSYGYTSADPRVIHLGIAQDSFPITFPTVQDGPLSETDSLTKVDFANGGHGNYIQWLLQSSVADISSENYSKTAPTPTALLYKVLRQSVILEYSKLAARAEVKAGNLQPSQFREAELISMGQFARAPSAASATTTSNPATLSVWQLLARPSLRDSSQDWGKYFVNLNPPPGSEFDELNAFRASLLNLAILPTAELDRLLSETLDACSHRLDVWATSIATAILKRTRYRGVPGLHLGCFGWLEDIRPAAQRTSVQGSDLQQARALDAKRAAATNVSSTPPPPLAPLADNGGFIYAPSPEQAAVAAVLRSGYMSHKGTSDEGLLSIDLSSERVRGALSLLEGVRQGQSLNAVLGYLFESALHDQGLAQYVQGFRDKYPMVATQLNPGNPDSVDTSNVEAIVASAVVDGLRLKSASDVGKLAVGSDWGDNLPGPDNTDDQQSITRILQALDGYADALTELSLAEAVYQTVRGNFSRAGGLMDAISKGQRPPDPDVISTPRGGVDITHRVPLLFAGPPAPNVWTNVSPRARTAAEPWLDGWLSSLLPDPKKSNQNPPAVFCQVRYHDHTLTNPDQSTPVSLGDLDLAPLDCLAMGENSIRVPVTGPQSSKGPQSSAAPQFSSGPQFSELEYRILYAAGVTPTADPQSITIDYAPTPAPSMSFPNLLFLWKTFRLLINGARPLTPQDLTVPENKLANPDDFIDLPGLLSRAQSALATLTKDKNKLQDSIDGVAGAPALPVQLMVCSYYGVPGSVPYSKFAADPRLADQAKFVHDALQNRVDTAKPLVTSAASSKDLLNAFQIMFGNDFVVLPGILTSPIPANQTPLWIPGALAQPPTLSVSDPAAPSRWFTQLTYIRPSIARLDTALNLARIIGASNAFLPTLQIAQLRITDGDIWLGLPFDPAKLPGKGRIAFACFTQGAAPSSASTYTGLMVDQWVERIPSPQERAAVAFHYEEPKARPPQSLLLAVCPDESEIWEHELVLAVLQEALELAKIRTVDLDSIQKVGQILPALYFPLNLQGATISANFALLQEPLGA